MTKRNFESLAVAVACGLAVGLMLAGCATEGMKKMPPVTVGDIVKMSKDGVPPSAIIEKIRQSGTVYRLEASELAKLKEQGVADETIDYMQKTHLRAVQRDQQREDARSWTRWDDGYYYGGIPFGWPYDPFLYAPPVIVVPEPREPGPQGGRHHDENR